MSDASPPDPQPPSLAGRLVALLRRPTRASGNSDQAGDTHPRWAAAALAALIAAGPLATIAGAAWLRSDAEKVATGFESQLAPRRAAEQEREKARVLLGAAITQPGPAALLDQVSAALPPEDTLARAERAEDGRLEIDVATSDPDALRGAMRRQPALAGLRDVRQREGEGRTLVLFRQSAR